LFVTPKNLAASLARNNRTVSRDLTHKKYFEKITADVSGDAIESRRDGDPLEHDDRLESIFSEMS